jgi:hypothetical protein
MIAPIPNILGYATTREGEVWSYKSNKFLKLMKKPNGYLSVDICSDKGIKRMYVHRLVAMTYIKNPNNLEQINHIDGVKDNNNVYNLEWCTSSHNQMHARRMGLNKVSKKQREAAQIQGIKNRKPVERIGYNGNIDVFISAKKASLITGINYNCIARCARGERFTAGGYKWKYILTK